MFLHVVLKSVDAHTSVRSHIFPASSRIESAREEALVERRRRNFVVGCKPFSFNSWTGERLDLPARGLLSRVMGISSRSRTALPHAEASLECEAVLPVGSQSVPPSARVLNVDGFSRVIGEPVGGVFGRAVRVTEGEAFLGNMGVYSRGNESLFSMLQVGDDEIVSWRERPLTHMTCVLAANGPLLFKVTGQSLLGSVHDPLLQIPSRSRIRLTMTCRWASWMLVLAPLYSSADRRVRTLVCISKQILDIAGGVHVGRMILTSVLATNAPGSDTRDRGVDLGGWRDGDDHRNDRFRCRDYGIRGPQFHFVGRRVSGQGPPSVASIRVNTTPQMTRFRDAKACNNWLQKRIDDHRIQSDYKYKSELQNPEGKKSVLGITSVW